MSSWKMVVNLSDRTPSQWPWIEKIFRENMLKLLFFRTRPSGAQYIDKNAETAAWQVR